MSGAEDPVAQVQRYLRGQNLEQLGRIDDAIAEYESAVAAGFDSTGPYDRLIALYAHRAEHSLVLRVVADALANVRTAEDKRDWYRKMGAAAERASASIPKAAAKPRSNA
ncbi:MAG TPA: hypothetical protein VNC78_03270 [Actinomycetota bacterium]|nr:hypothetical protein [Actinomycetota bacterium]